MNNNIDFIAIQNHINRNYKRWVKRYDNVVGVHIGEKKIDNKTQENNFAIVFHVTKKVANPTKKIPNKFLIKNENKKLNINSDVIETGNLILQGIKIGDTTKNSNNNSFGTISNYFFSSDSVYLGSNMHVLAPDMINNGIKKYRYKDGDSIEIILYNNQIMTTAILKAALFKGIDFGFAKINNPQFPSVIENKIKNIGTITGINTYSYNNYKNVKLYFYGVSSGLTECVLNDINVTKNYYDTQFNNLLKLNYCSTNGDSGAPLFDSKRRLVGFIFAGDQVEQASYALNINDILTYFQTLNL